MVMAMPEMPWHATWPSAQFLTRSSLAARGPTLAPTTTLDSNV